MASSSTDMKILRINTAAGQYTMRESQVSDRECSIVLWKWLKERSLSNPFIIQEVFECLRGNDYSRYTLSPLLTHLDMQSSTYHIITTRAERDKIVLQCTDGDLTYARSTLVRTFHFFDDYLTEHPHECLVAVPFTKQEVAWTIAVEDSSLSACYKCLAHFNPKSNLYPFYFNLTGVPYESLVAFSQALTDEEEKLILDYLIREQIVTPSSERKYLLVAFRSVRSNGALMEAIYKSRYPSYLFCTLFNGREFPSSDGLSALQTWDFTADQDDSYYSDEFTLRAITTTAKRALHGSSPDTLYSSLSERVMPYGVSLEGSELDSVAQRVRAENARSLREEVKAARKRRQLEK